MQRFLNMEHITLVPWKMSDPILVFLIQAVCWMILCSDTIKCYMLAVNSIPQQFGDHFFFRKRGFLSNQINQICKMLRCNKLDWCHCAINLEATNIQTWMVEEHFQALNITTVTCVYSLSSTHKKQYDYSSLRGDAVCSYVSDTALRWPIYLCGVYVLYVCQTPETDSPNPWGWIEPMNHCSTVYGCCILSILVICYFFLVPTLC